MQDIAIDHRAFCLIGKMFKLSIEVSQSKSKCYNIPINHNRILYFIIAATNSTTISKLKKESTFKIGLI